MAFLYDPHVHTSVGSRCSKVLPEEAVQRFAKMGYAGIFITEHFFNNPSTTVPFREIPWEEAIEQYCRPYEMAKAEGEKVGLQVFFGFENSYQGNDILTYGLGKDWLKAHPEIMDMPIRQYCEFARAEGGFVVHAHPFREAKYIDLIRLMPRSVDAVEILNGSCSDFQNDRAAEYARNYGLAVTGGSDYHGSKPLLCAIDSPVRFGTVADFCEAVRCGDATPVVAIDGRESGTVSE
ncbi:MAG: PHP domain-containing protein [Clostridia bacterium]|nr:PHP domain-containing protein [Clostridia bacterium]